MIIMKKTLMISCVMTILAMGCERGTQQDDQHPVEQQQASTTGAVDGSKATKLDPSEVAAQDEAKREQLIGMLGGFEYEPGPDKLYAVEEDRAKLHVLLLSIYKDDQLKKGVRQRGLGLLRYTDMALAKDFYEGFLRADDSSNSDVKVALLAYVNTPGVDPEEVLVELLQKDDVPTRIMVVKQLAKLQRESANKALDEHRKSEQNKAVIKAIDASIGAPDQSGTTTEVQ